jgi:hypothetical protein
MYLEGKIKEVKQTQIISEKFQKREFVIVTADEYPQTILIQAINDKCAILDNVSVGSNVKCSINIRGREWTKPETGEVKVFNTIEAWRIEQIGAEFNPSINTKSETPASDDDDDLPF